MKVHRYEKDTLKGQTWEMSLIEDIHGNFALYSIHSRKSGGLPIKDNVQVLSLEEASAYMSENQEFLIETYEK